MALHWKRIGTCFLIARQHCGAYKAYIEAHCFGGFYTSGFCKYTAHTASLDFEPVDFANTQHTLLSWILNQWILQIHSTHCFVWFCTSGFCKYRTGTASLDFAPVDFANTQHTLLRWILHRFLFAPSCGNHTHCISPLFWFGHTRYIGASNITILVNIVDQTLAAKADMFQEDS